MSKCYLCGGEVEEKEKCYTPPSTVTLINNEWILQQQSKICNIYINCPDCYREYTKEHWKKISDYQEERFKSLNFKIRELSDRIKELERKNKLDKIKSEFKNGNA